MGVEPTPSAWKAEVLPLNYTRCTPMRNAHPTRSRGRVSPKAIPSAMQGRIALFDGDTPLEQGGTETANFRFRVAKAPGWAFAAPSVVEGGRIRTSEG